MFSDSILHPLVKFHTDTKHRWYEQHIESKMTHWNAHLFWNYLPSPYGVLDDRIKTWNEEFIISMKSLKQQHKWIRIEVLKFSSEIISCSRNPYGKQWHINLYWTQVEVINLNRNQKAFIKFMVSRTSFYLKKGKIMKLNFHRVSVKVNIKFPDYFQTIASEKHKKE